jgi:hypothetical protein
MEPEQKKGISDPDFTSLENYSYNSHLHPPVRNKQLVLAKNLHRSYGIPEANILRLIMYSDFAFHMGTGGDNELSLSELKEIANLDRTSFSIERIIFRGKAGSPGTPASFEISNPYLIERLYNSLTDLLNLHSDKLKKHSSKGRKPATLLKKIARELYAELRKEEGITGSRPLYIIGYIFSIYGFGSEDTEPILTEKEFNARKRNRKDKGLIPAGSYLKYLASSVKKFIE